MSLNSKFDKFNETVSGKIDNIERNYDNLNAKIERLAQNHDCVDDKCVDETEWKKWIRELKESSFTPF